MRCVAHASRRLLRSLGWRLQPRPHLLAQMVDRQLRARDLDMSEAPAWSILTTTR